jgi:hypothetical protein
MLLWVVAGGAKSGKEFYNNPARFCKTLRDLLH